jgi:hypothetical protein
MPISNVGHSTSESVFSASGLRDVTGLHARRESNLSNMNNDMFLNNGSTLIENYGLRREQHNGANNNGLLNSTSGGFVRSLGRRSRG